MDALSARTRARGKDGHLRTLVRASDFPRASRLALKNRLRSIAKRSREKDSSITQGNSSARVSLFGNERACAGRMI